MLSGPAKRRAPWDVRAATDMISMVLEDVDSAQWPPSVTSRVCKWFKSNKTSHQFCTTWTAGDPNATYAEDAAFHVSQMKLITEGLRGIQRRFEEHSTKKRLNLFNGAVLPEGGCPVGQQIRASMGRSNRVDPDRIGPAPRGSHGDSLPSCR